MFSEVLQIIPLSKNGVKLYDFPFYFFQSLKALPPYVLRIAPGVAPRRPPRRRFEISDDLRENQLVRALRPLS